MRTPNVAPSIVLIEELSLVEVATSIELEATLGRVYDDGLPGFVIRAAGLVDIEAVSHKEVTQAIINTLSRVSGPFPGETSSYGTIRSVTKFSPFTSVYEGEVHHDVTSYGGTDDLRVHRTNSGGGKVFLANAGSLGARVFEPESRRVWVRGEDEVNELFALGYVDPAILSSTIYSGSVGPGDTVVFPTGLEVKGKEGPIWHRFDTDIAPREAQLYVVRAE